MTGVNIKRNFFIVPVILSLFVLDCSLSGSSGSRIHIFSDPGIELMSLIFRLAGAKEYSRGCIPSYNKEIDAHFAKFRDHAVVKLAAKLRETDGVAYDAVMSMAIFITDPYNLNERIPFDPRPEGLDKRWTIKNAREFLKAARSFVKESKYKEFIDKHRELYDITVQRLQKVVKEKVRIDWFKRFFGSRPGIRFVVIPGLLNGGGNYGPKIHLADGSIEVYSILGVGMVDKEGLPGFDPGIVFTIVHEFCHSFANPLVDKYAAYLKKAGEKIYPHVEDKMTKQAYGNWQSMMRESLVRACTARYFHFINDPYAARRSIQEDFQKGFIWTGELSKLLAAYETKRKTYPKLDFFMPHIVSFFNGFTKNLGKKFARVKKDRKRAWKRMKTRGPGIVSITPANGSSDADPALKTITIVFDRQMKDGSWAVIRVGDNHPEITGPLYYDKERKILTIPVELKPGVTYQFGLNAEGYLAFRSEEGIPLYPVTVRFKTRGQVKMMR